MEEDGTLVEVGATFGFVKEDVLLLVKDQNQSQIMEVVMSPPMIQVGSSLNPAFIKQYIFRSAIENLTRCHLRFIRVGSADLLSLLVSRFSFVIPVNQKCLGHQAC